MALDLGLAPIPPFPFSLSAEIISSGVILAIEEVYSLVALFVSRIGEDEGRRRDESRWWEIDSYSWY